MFIYYKSVQWLVRPCAWRTWGHSNNNYVFCILKGTLKYSGIKMQPYAEIIMR